MRKRPVTILEVLSTLVIFLALSVPAHGQGTYTWSLAAQATPDECFEGNVNSVGGMTAGEMSDNNTSFNNHYPPGLSGTDITTCISNGYLPKVNQAYVWGLTEDSSGNLWIGTVANTLCLVLDQYYGSSLPDPYEGADYVCDAKDNLEEDFKPPRMFMYNPATSTLNDLTSKIMLGGDTAILTKTFGIRSAGYYNGVVFFGGLELPAVNSKITPVVLFAFNAATQAYLGHYVFDNSDAAHPLYDNIRQWHVIGSHLFTGVGKMNGALNTGAMLRWDGTLAAPFTFTEVGELADGQPAYFVEHSDGRIYATTWGSAGGQMGMTVYMSDPLGTTTTGPDIATTGANWAKVWDLSNYEVEPTAVQLGGAIESFGGYLYFGTMQVPGTGVVAFHTIYPNVDLSNTTTLSEAILGTMRAIAIFRSPGINSSPTLPVDLLYGSADLPQYDASTSAWTVVANKLGATPTYGQAGFGNPFNNYTWSMAVFQNKLFVGTMDWSYLAHENPYSSYLPSQVLDYASGYYGADLWAFPNTGSAATLISGNGMGNPTSYGIRTMVADNTNGNLWIGMANPMILRTDSTNNPGGWKLIDFPTQSLSSTTTTLTASASSVFLKNPLTLTAQVTSAAGTPTGSVTFMDGSTPLGSSQTLGGGYAAVTISTLTAGSHSLTAAYSGDDNFKTSASSALTETVQDFQFTGSVVSATVQPGGLATFSFTVAPTNGSTFPGDVTLTLTGLPAGATYTISPSKTISSGSVSTAVTVQVQTSSSTALNRRFSSGLSFAILFLPMVGLLSLRRRARGTGILMLMLLGLVAMLGTNGCGGSSSKTPQTSTITVTGTSGSLQHSIALDLEVQ